MSVIQFKCKKCGSQEYVIKEVPNGSNVHKGLYCAKCGAWEKWLSKDDVVCGAETTKKTTAKERVEEEAAQLEERVENLRSFITNNAKYYKLREADQYLLRRQLETMQEYLNVLIARMSIWMEV